MYRCEHYRCFDAILKHLVLVAVVRYEPLWGGEVLLSLVSMRLLPLPPSLASLNAARSAAFKLLASGRRVTLCLLGEPGVTPEQGRAPAAHAGT